jgi:chromosome partitioning protein
MLVITFVNQKGGVGKSTLAINLAVTAARRGDRVALLDLDPQSTTTGWCETRPGDAAAITCVGHGTTLDAGLSRLGGSGATIALVDSTGLTGVDTRRAIQRSDLVLVPIRPSVVDVRATMPTVRALTVCGARYALVINQAPARLSARASCGSTEGPVLPVTLGARIDYQYAFAKGLGVDEFAPNGKAALEVAELWAQIRTRLAEAAAETRLRA